MRANFRRFGNDGQVDMVDPPAARRDAFAGEGEEAVRRRAAPLRIARREMVADVAVGKGAEDRVGQRMKRDIGIAMALKSMTMRDFHAADPQRLGRHEAVNVIAHPDRGRSEEHTSELQSLMRISYAVFCLKKKKNTKNTRN